MTVLSVARDVALSVGISYPVAVFSSTDRDMREMQTVANEAARMIAAAHDWQALRRVQTVTGDGQADAFDLPADYDRMPYGAKLWSSRYRDEMTHVVQADDWLSFDVWPIGALYGVWSIFGGQMHVRPTMAVGETVKFFYQRSDIVSTGQAVFTLDTDTFRLDERLLKLAMVYLWRQGKGQDFTAELADFEMAMDLAKAKDGGSKPVLSGNVGLRRSGRFNNVWPGTVAG